jgi:hypothetical protein
MIQQLRTSVGELSGDRRIRIPVSLVRIRRNSQGMAKPANLDYSAEGQQDIFRAKISEEVAWKLSRRKRLGFFLVKWVPGWGPEQRESGKTVLYPVMINIILISYIFIYYY